MNSSYVISVVCKMSTIKYNAQYEYDKQTFLEI